MMTVILGRARGMAQEPGMHAARWCAGTGRAGRGMRGLPSWAVWFLVLALACVALPASAVPAPDIDSPADGLPAKADPAADAMRRAAALRQQLRAGTTGIEAGTARAMANIEALSQATMPIPTPAPPDYSVVPSPVEFGVLVLVSGLLFAWLVAFGRGLRACTLYVHGRSCDARVVRRFLRLRVVAVVEYEFWSLQGRRTGIAPARCADGDAVRIVYNDAHPDWHRPRALLFDDLLTAGTFFLAPLTLLLLRLAGLLWDLAMQRLRGARAG